MNPTTGVMVNGKNYDWGNITLMMFNGLLTMVTKINFSEGRDSVNNYGIGQFPVSYGNKNFVYSASLSMYIDQMNQIKDAAPFKKMLMIPPFTTKMILSGDGVTYRTYKLLNCRFTANNFDSNQNDASIVVPVPVIYAGLIEE